MYQGTTNVCLPSMTKSHNKNKNINEEKNLSEVFNYGKNKALNKSPGLLKKLRDRIQNNVKDLFKSIEKHNQLLNST